ncbi:astacin, partial [Teladorsagia circumcincta]
ADRIIVKRGKGCSAALGRKGGEQPLSLGEGCEYVGTAAHEIGHALGVHHTMTRHDRDKFIKVNMENVEILLNFSLELCEAYNGVSGKRAVYMDIAARPAAHVKCPILWDVALA